MEQGRKSASVAAALAAARRKGAAISFPADTVLQLRSLLKACIGHGIVLGREHGRCTAPQTPCMDTLSIVHAAAAAQSMAAQQLWRDCALAMTLSLVANMADVLHPRHPAWTPCPSCMLLLLHNPWLLSSCGGIAPHASDGNMMFRFHRVSHCEQVMFDDWGVIKSLHRGLWQCRQLAAPPALCCSDARQQHLRGHHPPSTHAKHRAFHYPDSAPKSSITAPRLQDAAPPAAADAPAAAAAGSGAAPPPSGAPLRRQLRELFDELAGLQFSAAQIQQALTVGVVSGHIALCVLPQL
jgi:hypothetical protein